jgi:Flp pilus assembly CpaE family ATPase
VISTVIFGSNQAFTLGFQQEIGGVDGLCIYKSLGHYPTPYELHQVLSVFNPELVFLDITGSKEAVEIAKLIWDYDERVGIIGFVGAPDRNQLSSAAEGGIRVVLEPPFNRNRMAEAVLSVLDATKSLRSQNLFAFLPARAGSGATTVAAHFAAVLGAEARERVLLMEADIHSGVLGPLLKLAPEQSIIEALENAHWLDDENWTKFISKHERIDLLTAPTSGSFVRIARLACLRLLSFVRARYDKVIVDLPETLDEGTEAIVTRSKWVYIVSTAEPLFLLLARRRVEELKARGVADSRIGIILNRHTSKEAVIEEVENTLGRRVVGVIPNDYVALRSAARNGGLLASHSKLRTGCWSLASTIAGSEGQKSPSEFGVLKRLFFGST